ncbi:Heterotrimeric G-protein alpha subunit [Mycena sanguinolenta]|uniref:Heterotrimeric G-protein alpha subunit n=1 Tax=Mycena sanguinolenta TaxID=230812 RepID=A0A8H7CDU6_9AGAR|nr:Heterotrimeric G-protein alpha subunit [Mycena sanguinolenta]
MGANNSRTFQARSSGIDRLQQQSLQSKKEVPVLLLGSDEASRSTLVKHMKLFHRFTAEERAAFRSAIHTAVIQAAKAVVYALQESGLDRMLLKEHQCLLDEISGTNTKGALSRETADAIEALWRTPAVARVLDEHDSELNLPDKALFIFFSEIQRLAQPGYIPTQQDVLRVPAQKNTITEMRFTMDALSIRLIEVGPLRSERRKWIHYFESVTSVIFCTALSDYDQVLAEERGRNSMRESITLFSDIINSRWFLRTSIILFLTEVDVFKTKITKIPLERHFPEYTGGPDINNAVRFILWRFMQENRARLRVYPHLLSTIPFLVISYSPTLPLILPSLTRTDDTQSVRLVFAAVKDTILRNAIKDADLLDMQVL